MVDSFNEDDDLARLKDWWSQNGLALVLGAVVGLGAIGGWYWWKAHVNAQAEAAVVIYDSFTATIAQGKLTDAARAQANKLKDDYAGTPYAPQAAMALAGYEVSRQDYSKAITQLEWVVNHAGQSALRNIARVREARLLWAQDKGDAALALLAHDHPPAFAALYSELEGDIHASAGERGKARSAYHKALQNLPPDSDPVPLQRKLQAVAAAPSTKSKAGSSNTKPDQQAGAQKNESQSEQPADKQEAP